MLQSRINKAYPVILRLCNFKLPIKKARAIFAISVKMSEHFEFALSEEKKYVSKFNGNINPDGTVTFENREDFDLFQAKISEINNLELDWCVEPVTLTDNDIGDELISAADIQALDGFVFFE